MQLPLVLQVVWKRKWIIIGLTFIMVVAAAIYNIQRPKYYEASVLLGVDETGKDGEHQAQVYSQIVGTHTLAKQIVERYEKSNIKLTPNQIQGKINAQSVPGLELFYIDAFDSNPNLARDLANTAAEELIAYLESKKQKENKELQQNIDQRLADIKNLIEEEKQKANSREVSSSTENKLIPKLEEIVSYIVANKQTENIEVQQNIDQRLADIKNLIEEEKQIANSTKADGLADEALIEDLENEYLKNYLGIKAEQQIDIKVPVQIVDPAIIPQTHTGPSTLYVCFVAFVVGLILNSELVILLEGLKSK